VDSVAALQGVGMEPEVVATSWLRAWCGGVQGKYHLLDGKHVEVKPAMPRRQSPPVANRTIGHDANAFRWSGACPLISHVGQHFITNDYDTDMQTHVPQFPTPPCEVPQTKMLPPYQSYQHQYADPQRSQYEYAMAQHGPPQWHTLNCSLISRRSTNCR